MSCRQSLIAELPTIATLNESTPDTIDENVKVESSVAVCCYGK